jgi:hypothetical protein
MAANGGWNGPLPTGSTVQLIRSFTSGDRDWRASYILPLPIVDFSGVLEKDIARLTWKVENEGEVKTYVLERSKDGVNFQPIGQFIPKYTPTSIYNYDDDLTNFNVEVVYYRIQEINKNGQKSYSKIISFKRAKKEALTIKLQPNPVINSAIINIFSTSNEHVDISILDLSGKLMLQKTAELEKGNNVITIPETATIPKGLYMVVIVIKKAVYFEKFVKG